MNPYLGIIEGILPFAVTELQSLKVISPKYGGLITGIAGVATSLIDSLTARNKAAQPSALVVTLLASLQAGIEVLKAQTDIDPAKLAIILALDKALSAGITASKITTVDPDALQPIAPVV